MSAASCALAQRFTTASFARREALTWTTGRFSGFAPFAIARSMTVGSSVLDSPPVSDILPA